MPTINLLPKTNGGGSGPNNSWIHFGSWDVSFTVPYETITTTATLKTAFTLDGDFSQLTDDNVYAVIVDISDFQASVAYGGGCLVANATIVFSLNVASVWNYEVRVGVSNTSAVGTSNQEYFAPHRAYSIKSNTASLAGGNLIRYYLATGNTSLKAGCSASGKVKIYYMK
jgi:hypothetical protein